MVGGPDVFEALDIVRPSDRCRVLRARHDETQMGSPPSRIDQEALQHRLSVVAIGSEVAQVPSRWVVARTVALGVDAAIKRSRSWRTELPRQTIEHRAAGEGEIEIVAGDQVGREIVAGAALDGGHGDRRVDVVEGRYAPRMSLHEGTHGLPIRHIGTDQDGTSLGDLVAVAVEIREIVVEFEAAEPGVDEIASRAAVPGTSRSRNRMLWPRAA